MTILSAGVCAVVNGSSVPGVYSDFGLMPGSASQIACQFSASYKPHLTNSKSSSATNSQGNWNQTVTPSKDVAPSESVECHSLVIRPVKNTSVSGIFTLVTLSSVTDEDVRLGLLRVHIYPHVGDGLSILPSLLNGPS